jgi:hypothetical protein
VLSTDAAQAVAGEINGRMVTDVAAPVIKNEVKVKQNIK